jgi:LemA protein
MSSTGRMVAIGVVILLVLAGALGCPYNRFTTQEESVKAAFADVDSNLQRRSDLIPNLVETVKGVAQQEKDVFGAIAEARTRMSSAQTPADKIEAARQESSALSRLLVVVENYPQLRSSEAFANLMTQLEGTENRLNVARVRYNEQVRDYNQQIRRFPGNLSAKIFGFKEYPYYEVPDAAKTLPKVDFGKGK